MINFLIKTHTSKVSVNYLLVILCLLFGVRSFAQTPPSTPSIWSSQTNGVVTIHWSTPTGTVTRYTLSEDAGSREYGFGVGTNSFKPSITGNGIWYSIRACSGASASSCSPYSSYLPVNIPAASSSAPPSPSSSPKSSSPSSIPPVSSSSIASQPVPSHPSSATLEADSVNSRFIISWSNVSAYKYELQYSGAAETQQVGANWYAGPTLYSGISTTVLKSSVTDFVYYQWRVRACNSSNVCSAWTTTRKKAFPAIPVASVTSLLSPVTGATEPLLTCFSWKLDPNALDATITVSTTTDFPEKRWQLSVGKDTEAACFNSSWLIKGAYPEEIGNPVLVNGATYYWRVVTTMANGLAFTETRSFKASSATQPAPLQPASANFEADSINNRFTISWSDVSAYKYELQYSGAAETQQVGANWYAGPTLYSGTSTTVLKSSVTDFVYYQWRVRACNSSNVCSAWTTTRKKAFPAIPVTSVTSLLSPVTGATEPLLPCFSWKLDPNALDATITVSTTTDFPEKRWQLSVGKDTEASCFNSSWLIKGAYPEEIGNPVLVNGATYYWRVVTTMANGLAFTETRSFKASSATQPAPLQPASANFEADSVNNLFTINWGGVSAYKYELQYSGEASVTSAGGQSNAAPVQLIAGGTQGWGQSFIRSINATGGTLKLNNADGVAGAIGVAGSGTTRAIDDEIQNGESLSLTFDSPVSDASFGFAKLDYNVSAGHQVGVWIVLLNGDEVGRGEFNPTDSTRTGTVQVKNSNGNFILFDQIRFEAIKPGSDYVVTSFSAVRNASSTSSSAPVQADTNWYAGPTLYSGTSTTVLKSSVTDFVYYQWRVRACNSSNVCSAWTETLLKPFNSSSSGPLPTPVLTVIDADQDCFYIINFGAPVDVPANYTYELYERKSFSTTWQQIVSRSRARGNIPPFTLYSDGDTLNNRHLQGGVFEFRSRVCEDGTDNCGGYSTILPVNTSTSCSSVAMPIVKFEPLITTAVVGQDNVLSVSATTPQGTITQVSFYAGGESIGIDSSYPFSINWRPTTGGSTHIEAIAETSVGGTASTHYKFVTIVATSTVTITGMTASYSASPHGLKISWSQVTNATRYEVVRSVDGGATWNNRYSGSATHFVDTEIENHPGAIYYRIRACSSECSTWSTTPVDNKDAE